MKSHFETHRQEYRKSDRVQVQHILITSASDKKADRESAKSRLFEIKKEIEDGADFADMAAAYSDCPSGKQTGGSLGWVSKGTMVSEFDNVIFDMEVSSLSSIVESPLGFHLIRKTAHEKGAEATYDEARENIRNFLRHAKRGAAISAYVEELRGKAVIEES